MSEPSKPVCFVIQSFDSGKFDRRYIETIRPALIKADVDPQRADEILGLNPVIDKIEKAIESAAICIAEVSEDNPNVWLELGYALALNRPTVILCDRAVRSKLPFDIQHRPVILYRTDSRSGFDELERDIIRFVKNQLETERRIEKTYTLKPGSEQSSDLAKYEVSILATAFAAWPTPVGSISHWDLEKKLRSEGFTEVGLALGLSKLIDRSYLVERIVMEEDSHYGSVEVKHYQISPEGILWIQNHAELLTLQVEKSRTPTRPTLSRSAPTKTGFDDMEDDIPF